MPKGNGQNNNEEEKDIETVSVNNSKADEEEEKTEEQIDNEEEIDNDNDDGDGDEKEDDNEEEKSEEPQDEDDRLKYEKSYAWRINEWKKDAKANNYADFARSYVIDLITADMICGEDSPDPEENLRRDYDLNNPHLDEKCFHELADELQVQISRSQAYMAMVNNYTKEQFLEEMKNPIKAMNDYVKADKAEYERNPQYYKSEVRSRKSERIIRERRKQEEREFRESRRETAKTLYKEIKERKGPSPYIIDRNRTELNHKINDKRGSMYTPFNIPGVIEDNDALDICKKQFVNEYKEKYKLTHAISKPEYNQIVSNELNAAEWQERIKIAVNNGAKPNSKQVQGEKADELIKCVTGYLATFKLSKLVENNKMTAKEAKDNFVETARNIALSGSFNRLLADAKGSNPWEVALNIQKKAMKNKGAQIYNDYMKISNKMENELKGRPSEVGKKTEIVKQDNSLKKLN